MDTETDVVVLGAGIVGVSTALFLLRHGLSVGLIDRREPGSETSHGNAGIIQREAIDPYVMPRNVFNLLRHALNRDVAVHYHPKSLPQVLPFLFRYWGCSKRSRAQRTRAANIPLFAACLSAHAELAELSATGHLIQKQGWIRVLRHSATIATLREDIDCLQSLGLEIAFLEAEELKALEPHLDQRMIEAAVHYRDPWTTNDPGGLTRAYAKRFQEEGGQFLAGDAGTAKREGGRWRLAGKGFSLKASKLVVALGPWSQQFLAKRGLYVPMGIKRGYHCHFRPVGDASLSRPVADDETGFVLAPMVSGVRLTSGAEFAMLDAPSTPVQIDRALPFARELFPLGERVDLEAWRGARPVFPDLLPVIGQAPGLEDVWLNFGHAHHGLTLGPATGKLLAQMIAGMDTYCDPKPYSAARFFG